MAQDRCYKPRDGENRIHGSQKLWHVDDAKLSGIGPVGYYDESLQQSEPTMDPKTIHPP